MPGHDFLCKIRPVKIFYVFTHNRIFFPFIASSIQQEIFLNTTVFSIISDLWK